MKITITTKDLKKACITSGSGMVIDALAYAAGECTSDKLLEYSMDYEPNEPYQYNFETDLFTQTKTAKKLYALAQQLNVSINANWERLAKEQKLQAGACVALNNPAEWQTLLDAYTDKLKEDRTDGISKDYNTAMQDAIDGYSDEQYREWLNGDYRDYEGVVRLIAKYFTTDRDNGDYDKKTDEYTFTIDPAQAHEEYCGCYEDNCKEYTTEKAIKAATLDAIKTAGNNRHNKDKVACEKRQKEREELAAYKAKREAEDLAERKAKLEAMKA